MPPASTHHAACFVQLGTAAASGHRHQQHTDNVAISWAILVSELSCRPLWISASTSYRDAYKGKQQPIVTQQVISMIYSR